MYIFKLALKNIMRARRRTVLTFLMLSFGVAIYLVVSSMLTGADRQAFENLVRFETGHLKLRAETWDRDHPFDYKQIIFAEDDLPEKLAGLDFVTGVTRRTAILAEADNSIDSTVVTAYAIDYTTDKDVFELERNLSGGSLQPSTAVMGSALAANLKLAAGDWFFLTFRNYHGQFVSVELEIGALLHTSNPIINQSTVFIDLKDNAALIDAPGVSEIALRTDDYLKSNEYLARVKEVTADYPVSVYTWQQMTDEFRTMLNFKKNASSMISLIIIIIAVIGIINTMMMSVFEKRREIGTLKALGMTDGQVRNLFVFEGLLIGLFGSLAGMLLGTLLNLPFIYGGIDYSALLPDGGGLAVGGIVYSVWSAGDYLAALVISVTASTLASWYPARKGMKMQPVECLRTVQ